MPPATRTIVADRGDAGIRIDRVLCRHLGDVDAATRTRVQTWIEDGLVTVNGAPVRRVSTRTAHGDRVCVVLPEPKPRRAMSAEDAPLDVLYEDDHLLALNKPPGIVVHPAYKHAAGTLLNALLGHARGWPVGRRPSIVGRLDKDTSGVVLVAKSPSTHALLQHAMTRAEKLYLAIVYGKPPLRGAIDLRLHVDAGDRRRVVASTDRGAHSLTTFERLARRAAPPVGVALLRCRLATGRRHQIRVHLAARGWPIVGDSKYADPRARAADDAMLATSLRSFPRQALHAWRLAIEHPHTRELLRVEAPIPPDIAGLIARTDLILRP